MNLRRWLKRPLFGDPELTPGVIGILILMYVAFAVVLVVMASHAPKPPTTVVIHGVQFFL